MPHIDLDLDLRSDASQSLQDCEEPFPALLVAAVGTAVLFLLLLTLTFLTTDIAKGFAFDTGYMYASGIDMLYLELRNFRPYFLWQCIHKIEMSIIPGVTGFDYSAQSITTGVTNIPYVYHAIDYQNGDTPTLSEMRQNDL